MISKVALLLDIKQDSPLFYPLQLFLNTLCPPHKMSPRFFLHIFFCKCQQYGKVLAALFQDFFEKIFRPSLPCTPHHHTMLCADIQRIGLVWPTFNCHSLRQGCEWYLPQMPLLFAFSQYMASGYQTNFHIKSRYHEKIQNSFFDWLLWKKLFLFSHFSFNKIINLVLQLWHMKLLIRQPEYCTGPP